MITWTEELSVGVAALDDDHKKLFALCNELQEAMQHGHGREVFARILDGLVAYTFEHFAREEALLADARYPSLDIHHHAHERLKADVAALRAKFDEGGDATLMIDTLAFLQNWLKSHIGEADHRYAVYLKAHEPDAKI